MSDDFVFIPQEWGIPDNTFSATAAGGKSLIVCYSEGDIFVMDACCPVDDKHLGERRLSTTTATKSNVHAALDSTTTRERHLKTLSKILLFMK